MHFDDQLHFCIVLPVSNSLAKIMKPYFLKKAKQNRRTLIWWPFIHILLYCHIIHHIFIFSLSQPSIMRFCNRLWSCQCAWPRCQDWGWSSIKHWMRRSQLSLLWDVKGFNLSIFAFSGSQWYTHFVKMYKRPCKGQKTPIFWEYQLLVLFYAVWKQWTR